MDILEGLRARKTVRGFTDKKVSREVINEILTDAHWAPSASNQQPWYFHALSGKPLSKLCSAIMIARRQEKKTYDPSRGKTIPKEYVDRTRKLFQGLRPFLSSLGDDQRAFIETGSFCFYDAPAVIFISMHKALPETRLMDIGMAAQNLMLSALARGLGTCAVALTLLYADVINSELKIHKDFKTVLCICLGYPDNSFPVNRFRSSRDDIAEFVTWKGFDE